MSAAVLPAGLPDLQPRGGAAGGRRLGDVRCEIDAVDEAALEEFAAIGSITEEHFDKTFDTNVRGVVFMVQKALPLMPDGGAIVLNASIVSVKGMPNFGVYSATKAAVRSFARTWTNELKDRGIRVNVVSPGPIDTPGLTGLAKTEEERKAIVSQLVSAVPLGRLGQPDEVAKTVVFLASDDASYVAGVELFVDGGMVQV